MNMSIELQEKIKDLYFTKNLNRDEIAKELNLIPWSVRMFLTNTGLTKEKQKLRNANIIQKRDYSNV